MLVTRYSRGMRTPNKSLGIEYLNIINVIYMNYRKIEENSA